MVQTELSFFLNLTFREFIISLYLFEVKQGSSSLALYFPSLEIGLWWSSESRLTPCSVHATAELPTKLDQRCAWALLFGQTTRWSKNMLTYFEFGSRSECCLSHGTLLLPGERGNCCVKGKTRAPCCNVKMVCIYSELPKLLVVCTPPHLVEIMQENSRGWMGQTCKLINRSSSGISELYLTLTHPKSYEWLKMKLLKWDLVMYFRSNTM